MHARHVGHQAGGVGDRHHLDRRLRAVDELDQHARIHVALGRLLLVVGRHGVELQRVVLALAGGDDVEAEAPGKADDLQRAGRLVAGGTGIDDAGLARLLLEEAADGDVGLDVEHDDMLAVLHHFEREQRADVGVACRVDDDVDAAGGGQRMQILGHRDLAGLDGAVDVRGGAGLHDVGAVMAGEQRRVDRRLRPHLGDGADPHARHQRYLDDDVGAHLPGAGEPDGDRVPAVQRAAKVPLRIADGPCRFLQFLTRRSVEVIILNIPISK